MLVRRRVQIYEIGDIALRSDLQFHPRHTVRPYYRPDDAAGGTLLIAAVAGDAGKLQELRT